MIRKNYTHLLMQPSLRKYKSLTSRLKNGMIILDLSLSTWDAPAERHMAAFSVDR